MRKNIATFFIGCMSFLSVFAQTEQVSPERYTANNKGKFFMYWGGNRGYYSKSDIQFKGSNYNEETYNIEYKLLT